MKKKNPETLYAKVEINPTVVGYNAPGGSVERVRRLFHVGDEVDVVFVDFVGKPAVLSYILNECRNIVIR